MPLRTGSARGCSCCQRRIFSALAQPVPPSSVQLVTANHVSQTCVAAGHTLGLTLARTCTTDILVRRSLVEQLARPNTFCARTMWK